MRCKYLMNLIIMIIGILAGRILSIFLNVKKEKKESSRGVVIVLHSTSESIDVGVVEKLLQILLPQISAPLPHNLEHFLEVGPVASSQFPRNKTSTIKTFKITQIQQI